MIRNNNFSKSSDFVKDDYKERMNSYFNPFEYNIESNMNFEINSDVLAMRSKNHMERKKVKK